MQIEQIVERMKEGYTLINRNTGWFLSEKQVPYKRQSYELIDGSVVDEMEKRGIIVLSMPYNSCIASLVEDI